MTTQLDAFGAPSEAPARARTGMDAGHHALAAPATRGMARTGDPVTAKDAATVAATHADRVLELVRLAFDTRAMLTAKEAEGIVCARHQRIERNTVRCRFADLANKHLEIVPTGEVRDRCRVFRLATREERMRLLEGKSL